MADVKTIGIRQGLRSQRQLHRHRSLGCETFDQQGIFGGDGGGGDFWHALGVAKRAGVRQVIADRPGRAIQRCYCT